MRATLTVEVPVPECIVSRLRALVETERDMTAHMFFDDKEASAAMANGADAAKAKLDAAAKKIGLSNAEQDIQYGVGGVRGWKFWYQRTFS